MGVAGSLAAIATARGVGFLHAHRHVEQDIFKNVVRLSSRPEIRMRRERPFEIPPVSSALRVSTAGRARSPSRLRKGKEYKGIFFRA